MNASNTLEQDTSQLGWPRAVWWILLLGVGLRIVFFFLSENTGGDAMARAAMTEAWLDHPSWRVHFRQWLPLHFWLMGGLTILVGDVSLAGRLLSLILGSASLGLFWRLAREIYGDAAATLSLLVFSLYSLHIGYSTTSSWVVPYLFFTLAGLVGFFRYRSSGSLKALALGGIAFTMAAAIRYEAWVIVFAAGLVLLGPPWRLFQRKFWRWDHLRALLVFGLTAGLWPGFWLVYEWITMGHPLYFVALNREWVAQELAFWQRSFLYRLSLPPAVIVLTLSPPLLAGALYGFRLAIRNGRGRELAVLLLLSAVAQFYQIASGGLMPFGRYTMTEGTLLAVFSGHGLLEWSGRWRPQAQVWLPRVVAGVLLLNLAAILLLSEVPHRYSDKFGSISPRLRFNHYIQDVGDYLEARLRPEDTMVIDDFNMESGMVAMAAGMPLRPGDRAFLANIRKGSELLDYLKVRRPRYLVYSDRGTLRPYLPLPTECSLPASIAEMDFRCVFENDIYRVYEIRYR